MRVSPTLRRSFRYGMHTHRRDRRAANGEPKVEKGKRRPRGEKEREGERPTRE